MPSDSELNEAMAEIDKIRKALYSGKYWQDGEAISSVAVKLALLNSFLGDHIAQYEWDMNTFESIYKSTREQRKLELMEEGMSGTKSDSQAFTDTKTMRDEWNKSIHNFKQLQVKRYDTTHLIDTLRSRLSFMKADREALKSGG